MPTRTVIPQITGQPIRLHITALDDADETTIITVIHGDANPLFGESFAHTRAGALRQLGRDSLLGKTDSGGGRRYRDGMFRQYVSEADQVVNAPGSSVDVCYYDTPGVFPVQAPPTTGGIDQATLNRIAQLENQVRALQTALAQSNAQIARHETRLDAGSAALTAAGTATQG